MGDPSKYTRRRQEQLAEEQGQALADDPDPFGKLMASQVGPAWSPWYWIIPLVVLATIGVIAGLVSSL
jgi:hypothetical protein